MPMNNEIVISNHTPQDITITQDENQLIFINGGGEVIGVTDVKVNGTSVVSNNIAYVIVPTKTSELTNNSGFITSENDPTVPSYVKTITLADINSWNNKQDLLVSGTNIKTINNNSLLGSGNIDIQGGESYSAGTGIDITNGVISNTITSYNDLTDLPTIPNKTSDLINDSNFVDSEDLAEVAFTGSYNSLSDTPIIPSATSELTNDSNFITSQEVSTEIQTAIATKQDTLVSGTNIKTINSQSLLGSGNLNVDTSVHTYNRLDILAITSTSDQTYVDILDDITNDREFVIKSSSATYDVVTVRDDSGTISLVFLDFNAGIGSRLHRILLEVSGSTVTATDSLLKTPSDLQINGTSIVNSSTSIADIETKSAYDASTNKIATETDIASYHDSSKQDTLVSGTNIKTINNTSILGSGNINISATDVQVNGTSIVNNNVANIITESAYNSSTNKIATKNDTLLNYNSNETIIGTWINGKTLYRKIVSIPSFSTNGTSVQTGITNIDFAMMSGYFLRSNTNYAYPIANYFMDELRINTTTGLLEAWTNNANVEFYGYIIIEYTKS